MNAAPQPLLILGTHNFVPEVLDLVSRTQVMGASAHVVKEDVELR